jgi:hypothetical protein
LGAAFLFFIYICIVVGDPVIRGGGGGWNPINQFKPATFLCLSQDRIWISNAMPWFFIYGMRKMVIARFIDIIVIVDHHCLIYGIPTPTPPSDNWITNNNTDINKK